MPRAEGLCREKQGNLCIDSVLQSTHDNTILQNRCHSLESKEAESRGVVAELTQRTEKFRKAYKELGERIVLTKFRNMFYAMITAAETAAQKGAMADRDAEIAAQRQRIERIESDLRNCKMELEHSREELRGAKCELKVAKADAKQLEIQLDIVHEQEVTHKAERRLRQMDSDRQSLRAVASRPVPSKARGGGIGGGFDRVQLRPYDSHYPNQHSGSQHSESSVGVSREQILRSRHSDDFHQQTLPPPPPQQQQQRVANHTSHEWVRHSVSRESGDSFDEHNEQMAAAERQLDRDVVQSNAAHISRSSGHTLARTQNERFEVELRDSIPATSSSISHPEKRPHYIVERSPARAPSSNTVAFIRSRVEGGEARLNSNANNVNNVRSNGANESHAHTSRPTPLSIPQTDTRPPLPSHHHPGSSVASSSPSSSSVKSPDSVCSSGNPAENRVQKMYAKIQAMSNSGGNSVSSKQ